MGKPVELDRAWFSRHPVVVAWELIGCVLTVCRDGATVAGRIVEAEAYAGPGDPASHASRLAVAKQAMAGPPGTVYTYLSYGIHTMMNIVSHEPGQAGGILLRAIEPLAGLDVMRERRRLDDAHRLGKGPGSLGQAFGIRLTDIGTDIFCSPSFDVTYGEARHQVHAGPRIGISKATLAPWRFFEHPSPFVSGHRRGHAVRREDVPLLIPPPGAPIQ
jgi:DNA-3-methyladenine glycosylase